MLASGGIDGNCGLTSYFGQLGSKSVVFGLKGQDPFDTFEVQAIVGQVLDPLQQGDVAVAITTAPTLCTSRGNETLALIDSQRLGVYPCEFGCDRDDVDRSSLIATAHVLLRSSCPGRCRGRCHGPRVATSR